jgi:hypothetical protein
MAAYGNVLDLIGDTPVRPQKFDTGRSELFKSSNRNNPEVDRTASACG